MENRLLTIEVSRADQDLSSSLQDRFPCHYEAKSAISASAESVFAHVDDQTRLSSHMSQSSWRMGGGSMKIEFDEDHGQAVGSRIRLSGRVLGMQLSVEEVVVERISPRRKAWETIGSPRLLAIGHYRMGFDIEPQGKASLLSVYIDYALPPAGVTRWLGWLFGRFYARWCVEQMVRDTAEYFKQHSTDEVVRAKHGASLAHEHKGNGY